MFSSPPSTSVLLTMMGYQHHEHSQYHHNHHLPTTTAPMPLAASSRNISVTTTNLSLQTQITLITYCYILPIICVVGIIGNITNLITLASRRLRAVSYMYLRALAVADLFCMIFVLLFVSGEILQRCGMALSRSRYYAIYQAHFMLSLINWALATGVLVVVALSLERFVSIVFPMHFRIWNSPQRATKAIAAAYLIPAILYIPYGIGRYQVAERINAGGVRLFKAIDSDISKTVKWQAYKWTREGLLRFAPIIILCVLNVQIVTAFRKRQKMFARLTNRNKENVSATNKDDTLIYILAGIVVMFFICNIPAAINLLFINETVKQRVDYEIFRALANLLEITNHASQFYVFCACSQDYRITFLQKFPCFKSTYTKRLRLKSIIQRVPTTFHSSTSVDDSERRAQMTDRQFVQHHSSDTGVFISNSLRRHLRRKINIGGGELLKESAAADTVLQDNEDTVAVQLVTADDETRSEDACKGDAKQEYNKQVEEDSDMLLQAGVMTELISDINGVTFL